MNKIKLISIGIALIVVFGGYMMFSTSDSTKSKFAGLPFNFLFGEQKREAMSDNVLSEWQNQENLAATDGDALSDFDVYVHLNLPFSFGYPNGMTVTALDGENGDQIILIQGQESGDEFQISIRPFDEPGPLTPERIKRDLPSLYIEEPQQALIGPEKDIPALIFLSQDPVIGKTREVWFVHGGYLYQLSGYADFDPTIARIMGTWRFYE